MKENKHLYRNLLIIGIPITLQCIMQSLLPIIDELMVGQFGDIAISSITAGNRIYNIYYFIVLSLAGATSIYVTQFWGNKKPENIPKAFKIPLIIGFVALGIYLGIAFLLPTQSISLFSSDAEIIANGAIIQQIYALSALPVLFSNLFATLLRSTKQVKVPMFCGIFSVVLNTVLNYVLIFGFYFIPSMTIYGAALATLIARTIEALLLAGYIYIVNRNYKFNLIKIFGCKVDKEFKKVFYESMIPLLTLNILFIVADTIYSAIYGQMSASDLAAASIMFPIQSFSIGLFNGMASATAIILGTELGKENYDTAISYSKKIIKITTVLSIMVSILLACFSYTYVSFYNVSDEVLQCATLLVIVSAFYLTVKILNMVTCQGIIQSGGNTKYVLFLDIIGPWCVGIPMALLGAYVFHFPIYIVFAMLSIEEVVRLVLALVKVYKFEWATNIVSDLKV